MKRPSEYLGIILMIVCLIFSAYGYYLDYITPVKHRTVDCYDRMDNKIYNLVCEEEYRFDNSWQGQVDDAIHGFRSIWLILAGVCFVLYIVESMVNAFYSEYA